MPVRTARLLAVTCAASLLAACGSTVQMHGSVTTNGLTPVSDAGGATSLSDGAAGVGSAGTLPSTRGGGGQAVLGPGSLPTAAVGTSGAHVDPAGRAITPGSSGKGWDAKHVYLGILVATDAGSVLHTVGVSIDPGDQVGDAKAIVADLNRRGGLLGRQVVLLVKDDHYASAVSQPASTGQADCTYFTQDHPVVAVVNTTAAIDTDTFRACFAHAQTPLVALSTVAFENHAIETFAPYFYNALSASWTRLTPVLVRRLQADGYFTPWNTTTGASSPTGTAKVGVLYGSTSSQSRIGPMVLAALHRAGYATDSFQYTGPKDMNAAVVHFAGNGVTHLITDGAAALFLIYAKSQGYKPRLGITTNDGVQALLESNSNHAYLNGALGVGWYPALDVDQDRDPGPGPGTNACLAALRSGGQTFQGKRFAEAFGLAVCDGLNFAAFGAKNGRGLDPLSIRRGIVSKGSQFPTGGSFASGLTADNFGMPGAARDLAFDGGCSCFVYRGATYPL